MVDIRQQVIFKLDSGLEIEDALSEIVDSLLQESIPSFYSYDLTWEKVKLACEDLIPEEWEI